MKLKHLLVGGLFFFGISAAAQENTPVYGTPQDSIEYHQAVEKMLEVSGSLQAIDSMLPQIKAMIQSKIVESEGGEQAFQMLHDFFEQLSKDMVEVVTPVYRKYFSIEDIQDLIVFYESPVGQKFAVHMTEIMRDAVVVGQNYAKEKMQQVIQSLMDKKLLKEI